ncbi:MAG: hypothetical protein V1761_01840 [bacterium]
MATYTKGFKKQTGETLLLKVIVGIIGAVLLIVLAAFFYDLATNVGTYDDYTHITAYDKVLTQVDADQDQLQDYLIYFYSDTCTNCEKIQKEALQLVSRINRDETIVFFVNITEATETASGDKDALLLAINLSSLATPMIVAVVDGEFYRTYVGTEPVIDLLKEVKAGDYTPFQ